jgi:hypothetical protein
LSYSLKILKLWYQVQGLEVIQQQQGLEVIQQQTAIIIAMLFLGRESAAKYAGRGLSSGLKGAVYLNKTSTALTP